MAPLAQRAWQDDPQEETRSYVERIRELVEQDQVGAARALVAEAVEKGVQEERLPYWREILAPAKVLRTNPELDVDRTPDYDWLKENSYTYRGQWVALFGGELLAHGETLQDVMTELGAKGWESRPGRRALCLRIGEWPDREHDIRYDETRPYVERIRAMVEQDRVGAARALVAEAVAKGVEEEGLENWQRVLAPARVLGRTPVDKRVPEA